MENIEIRRAEVKCHVCKSNSITNLTLGTIKDRPEDFEIRCNNCDNWESGSFPLQSFEVIQYITETVLYHKDK